MKKVYILMVLALLLVGCGTKKKLTNRYNNDTEITTSEKSEKNENTLKIDSATSESKEVKTESKEEKNEKSTNTVEVEEGTDITVKGDGSGKPISVTEENTETGKKLTFDNAESVSITNTRRELNQQINELQQSNTVLSQEITKKDSRIEYLESELTAKQERIVELEQSEKVRESDVKTTGFNLWKLLWILPLLLIGYILYQLWKKFKQVRKARDDLTSL